MTAVEQLIQEINKLTGLTIAMDEPCVEEARVMEKSQQFWNYMRGWDDGCQNKVQNPWNNNNKSE